MPPTTIRPLDEDDFAAWWKLRLTALRDHPNAFGQDHDEVVAAGEGASRDRYTGSSIANDSRLFGAFDSTRLVGTVCIVRSNAVKLRHRMVIWGLYVTPQARGVGTGRRLFEAAIGHARQVDGVLQVHLTVVSHNRTAIALYSRLGFVAYGHAPRTLKLPDRFVDEEFMVLMLDTSPGE